MNAKASSVDSLSFEAALAELEAIVKGLETGKTDLAGSIDAYERGIVLKLHCEKKLQEAQARIEKISVGPDGKPVAVPFDSEE